MKKSVTFRLSEEARVILAALAAKHGLTMTATIEMMLRKKKKR